jgi:hypothetical protein
LAGAKVNRFGICDFGFWIDEGNVIDLGFVVSDFGLMEMKGMLSIWDLGNIVGKRVVVDS